MKNIIIASLFLIILSINSYADTLDIGTHASYYVPPEEGATSTLMLGVDGIYQIGGYFSAKLTIENSNYTIDQNTYSLTPITLSIVGHPYPGAALSPYIGFGAGYYDKKVNTISNSTTGIHAMIGISVNIKTLVAGIELKYTIPDIKDGHTNYTSVTGNMTGGLHAEF